jgi:hypothetical protein
MQSWERKSILMEEHGRSESALDWINSLAEARVAFLVFVNVLWPGRLGGRWKGTLCTIFGLLHANSQKINCIMWTQKSIRSTLNECHEKFQTLIIPSKLYIIQ